MFHNSSAPFWCWRLKQVSVSRAIWGTETSSGCSHPSDEKLPAALGFDGQHVQTGCWETPPPPVSGFSCSETSPVRRMMAHRHTCVLTSNKPLVTAAKRCRGGLSRRKTSPPSKNRHAFLGCFGNRQSLDISPTTPVSCELSFRH